MLFSSNMFTNTGETTAHCAQDSIPRTRERSARRRFAVESSICAPPTAFLSDATALAHFLPPFPSPLADELDTGVASLCFRGLTEPPDSDL